MRTHTHAHTHAHVYTLRCTLADCTPSHPNFFICSPHLFPEHRAWDLARYTNATYFLLNSLSDPLVLLLLLSSHCPLPGHLSQRSGSRSRSFPHSLPPVSKVPCISSPSTPASLLLPQVRVPHCCSEIYDSSFLLMGVLAPGLCGYLAFALSPGGPYKR